ncbi:hypothetical protein [Marinobacter changyiensis]|nr:hypothetical protein [Marinobacter changyiensis]
MSTPFVLKWLAMTANPELEWELPVKLDRIEWVLVLVGEVEAGTGERDF